MDGELCIAYRTSANGFSDAISKTRSVINGLDKGVNEIMRDMCERSIVKRFEDVFFEECGGIRECAFCCNFSGGIGLDNGGGQSDEIYI